MAIGTHRLLRVVGGVTHFAEVSVDASPSQTTNVVVSPDVFVWLKDEYGPDAFEWPACDDYRAGAVFGVEYALAHLERAASRTTITVLRIRVSAADSTREDVVLAACHATWKALGDAGRDHLDFG